jgi:hypothetical protein
MDKRNYTYKTPVLKNNKYISYVDNSSKIFLNDIKIKSINKLIDDKGYILKIFIPNINDVSINEIMDYDLTAISTITKNIGAWFNKDLSEDDVLELYKISFCEQTSTLSVILSSNKFTKYNINNNQLNDNSDIINIIKNNKNLKKYIISVEIENAGLYFLSDNCFNKWVIKSINLTDIEAEENIYDKREVEESLLENVTNVIHIIDTKLKDYTKNKEDINKLYDKIINTKNNKTWIDLINKLNILLKNY